jgi:hypothetical protein
MGFLYRTDEVDEVSLSCLLKDIDFIHDNYTCISM